MMRGAPSSGIGALSTSDGCYGSLVGPGPFEATRLTERTMDSSRSPEPYPSEPLGQIQTVSSSR